MAEVQTSTWNETAASNTASPPDGAPEGMVPSGTNDWMRETQAVVKREWNRSHPTVSSATSTTAFTLTYTTAPAAYAQGLMFAFKVHAASTGSVTLNVNALGAKKVYRNISGTPTQVASGEWQTSDIVVVSYDTTLDSAAGGFFWVNAPATGVLSALLLPAIGTAFQRPQVNSGASAVEYSGPDGYKNFAGRNGGLEVWQRGAGGAASIAVAASTTAYTADGWALKTGANQACTVSQQAGIATGSRWCARVQRNSGQTGTGALIFEFPLDTDEIVALQGKKVTLSMTISTGANWSPSSGNITVALYTGTGSAAKRSAGSYTGDNADISTTQAIAAGTAAARYTFTSASTLGASVTQASIYLTWTPVGTASTNDWFQIDDVQLEISPVATQFERRPFEAELRACQRHYWKSFAYATGPAQNVGINTGCLVQLAIAAGANLQLMPLRWPVPMRVAPSVTTYNPAAANAQMRDLSTTSDCSSTAASSLTTEGGIISAVGNAGSGVTSHMQVHATFDAGI